MEKLKNKTVFITGGLSGIGFACAQLAAKHGAHVAVADLKSAKSDEIMAEIRKYDPTAMCLECNVADFDQVGFAIDEVIKTYGTLDVALNNAGIGGEASRVGDMTEKAWLQVIGVNLNGVFNCMKHELTQMAKQKSGSIINMSSILGRVGFAMSSHYVAAKHGVIGLTQNAAVEYATDGIRVNAICPGFIETPLLAGAGITKQSAVGEYIIGLHPMKRLGNADEIAKGFLFLASDDSSFVTGTALEMDGGYLAV